MLNQNKELIRKKIISGDLKEALDLLLKYSSSNQELNNQVTSLASRYSRIKEQEMQQTLAHVDLAIEKNKITTAILELLESSDRNSNTKITKSKFPNQRIFFLMGSLLILSIFAYNYFFKIEELVVQGKVYTIENGNEKMVSDCKVKIVNLANGISTETNNEGIFNLNISGKNEQDIELQFIHTDFESQSKTIAINFRNKKDTIFSQEFELERKENIGNEILLKKRAEKYEETSKVLAYLSSSSDFHSEEYQSKMNRFWELYNFEMSAVETPEVENQMVKIGRVIKKMENENENAQLMELKKELFLAAYDLAQIFKKNNFQ